MCKGSMYGPFEFDANGELAELELVAEDLHQRAAERAIALTLRITDAFGQPVPRAYVEVQEVASEDDPIQDLSGPLAGWQ